jgi:ferredoxin--NADP+ reductase
VAYTKVASLPLELEAAAEPPLNTYKNKQPYIGTIKSVERIVGPNATGETCHIIIDHNGDVPYWEGQSYGIIPPVSCQFLTLHWDTQVSAPSIEKRVSN